MIHFDHITETYRLKFFYQGKLKEKKITVLEDFSLIINSGETVNLIGSNGCGKTTLLKVAAGIISPQQGQVNINGRVGIIMDIGCGFHPDLTARENIVSSLALYEVDQSEQERVIEYVKEFSELGDFFDAPVRTYSQGMYLKMSFSFALGINPDILLIDDIIAVGDEKARFRCLQKIDDLRESGKTVVLVTHDLKFAENFAGRTVWLRDGMVFEDGPSKEIIPQYRRHFNLETNEGYSPLRLERNEKNENILWFHRRNMMVMEKLELSINYLNENYLSTITTVQRSTSFIRMIFSFSDLSFIFRCDCHLDKDRQVFLELFLEDPRGELNSDLKIEFSFIDSFFRAVSFLEESYSDCRRIRSVFGDYESLPFSGSFHFGANSFANHAYEWRNEKLFITINPQEVMPVFRLFAFDLALNVKSSLSEKTLRICNNYYEVSSVENSLRFLLFDRQLFNYEGLNVIFYYRNNKYSLSESEDWNISFKENIMKITHSSNKWPVKIIVEVTLIDNKAILKVNFDKLFPCVIEMAMLQLILNNSILNQNKSFVKASELFFENESEKISISTLNMKKIITGSYKNALTVSCFAGSEENDCEDGFLLERVREFPQIQPIKQDHWFFTEGIFKPPIKLLDDNSDCEVYLSFFSNGKWHDSSQADWVKRGAWNEGLMPWIPVKLIISEENLSADNFSVDFYFIPQRDFQVERVQCCFSIKKSQDCFSDSLSLFEPVHSLENIDLGHNLTLNWIKKMDKMSAFTEVISTNSKCWHIDAFTEGHTFEKDKRYSFCRINIKKSSFNK